ncbi:MAG: serine/threonine protein kinase [Vulcanimicrobiota bacterium]
MQDYVHGDVINEQYRVVRLIGQGGMNKIYLVEDLKGESNYAMKVTKDPAEIQMNAPEAYNKFLKEITILTTIKHPILPRLKDYFAFEDKYYIIEEFIQGESLAEYISRNLPNPKEVIRWSLLLCNVLETLHSNSVIFRDLKPDNIMLTTEGTVKLIDFDISRHYKEGQRADTMLLGTPGYAAPETYGKAQSDARSDIYSLGATMHHLLTGINPQDMPFHFEPLETARPGLSKDLMGLLNAMLSMKPEQRPQNMDEVRKSLSRILKDMEQTSKAAAPSGSSTVAAPQSFFDMLIGGISSFFNVLENAVSGSSDKVKAIIVNQNPVIKILDRSSWKAPWGPVEMIYPDTYACYPQKVTDVFVGFQSIRVTKKAPLRVNFSFSVIYENTTNYKPWNLYMSIYTGMPLDDGYTRGKPHFGVIPGNVKNYVVQSPNKWSGDAGKTVVEVIYDGSSVKGEFIWEPQDDTEALQYTMTLPWMGPRFVLAVSQAYYTWVYTKGFYICPGA